jgi:hypothetical protein
MRYHLMCSECEKQRNGYGQFTAYVSPNNEGIYNVKCPNGHPFSVDILLHQFQVLFENGIHALSNGYYVESFVSFVTSYERFIEYFLNVVLKSNGVSRTEFDTTWKELAKQSERQVGAFYLVYLQEFREKPNQLNNKNRELRNSTIHKGYLPSKEDCIKFGDNVLEFIRPIIELLKNDKKYEKELIGSLNHTGDFENKESIHHYSPYQIFAINRPINQTENKSISDFLEEQRIIKNKA